MKTKREPIMDAARRGVSWLISKQNAEGQFGSEDDVNAYYKDAYPLRIAGEPAAAAKCMNYSVKHFMTEEGDFMNSRTQRSAGSYTRYYCQIYPNFWFLRGACALNRFDLAQRIFGFLKTCQDETTGGAYYEVDRKSGLLDSNSTACICLGGQMCGDLNVAAKAGDAMLAWAHMQKDPNRYYLRWQPKGALQTGFDEDKSLYYVVDAEKTGQYYWQVGLPLVALAKLYTVTKDANYLKGAVKIYDFLMSCQPDVVASSPVGKLGWGSAILFNITGDSRYKETNRKITEYIMSKQNPDGYWLAPTYKTVNDQPLRITTDLTGEFSAWLLDFLTELG